MELPRRIGSYEILATLGKGGMGQVYKALQPSLNRVVAIKVLVEDSARDPKEVERFRREAQAVAMLNHPNVVQIIDRDRDGDAFYFVMEYVPGVSLDALLRQRRLSLRETLDVFGAICAGLDAAHEVNIVHRDLNPRNVLVSEDLSVVKLADFGISRVESISQAIGTLSTTRYSIGVLAYMAPEQVKNMAQVDHRADIYSAGVLLYQMLTGSVPVAPIEKPSRLNSDVPAALDAIVLKCLAPDPAQRFANVRQLLGALKTVEERLDPGSSAEPPEVTRIVTRLVPRTTEIPKAARGRRPALVLSAIIALALAGGSALLWMGRSGEERMVETAPTVQIDLAPRFRPSRETDGKGGPVLDLNEAAPPLPDDSSPAVPKSPTAAAGIAEPNLQVVRDKVAERLFQSALTDLEAFLEKYPDSRFVPDALLLKADIYRQQNRLEQAHATLVEIGSRFSESPPAAEALFRRGELMVASNRKARKLEARELFAQVAEDYPLSIRAPDALAAKAVIEREEKIKLRDPGRGVILPAALATYRQIVERYADHPAAEEALWQMGQIHASMKRFDLAVQSFEELGRRFPSTRFEVWWKVGKLYDRKLDDAARARDSYRRVLQGSPNFSAAQKRLRKLGG